MSCLAFLRLTFSRRGQKQGVLLSKLLPSWWCAVNHRHTFTVKVPSNLSAFNSDMVSRWLRQYFIAPIQVPPDPGAGECIVRVSADERLVSKLAEGLGERPAPALRRLVAAYRRELPPASSCSSSEPSHARTFAGNSTVADGIPVWLRPYTLDPGPANKPASAPKKHLLEDFPIVTAALLISAAIALAMLFQRDDSAKGSSASLPEWTPR